MPIGVKVCEHNGARKGDGILAHIDFLDEQIELLSEAIEEQLRPFATAVELLCTIPGVGDGPPR